MGTVAKLEARVGPKPTAGIENITPERAKEYLKTMVFNRKLNQTKVLGLAMEMDAGRWVLNGQTVVFNSKGNMIDGQHRMEACALAGKPFMTHVVRGIDNERAFATIDVGGGRTHSDIFSIAGVSDPANASAAAHILFHVKKGTLVSLPGPSLVERPAARRLVKGSAKFSGYPINSTTIPKEELLAFFEPYKNRVSVALQEMDTVRIQRVFPRSMAAALYVLFSEKSAEEAHAFMRAIATGEGLAMTDPAYVLRERLMQNKRDTKGKLSRWAVLLMLMKAWNARRSNEKMRYIRIVEKEKFPKIV